MIIIMLEKMVLLFLTIRTEFLSVAFKLRLFLYQQLFGNRESPGGIGSTNHKGIDIPAPTGTPIYAAASGTIVAMLSPASSGGAGYYTKINHDGKGLITEYMHQSKFNPNLSVGDKVKKVISSDM